MTRSYWVVLLAFAAVIVFTRVPYYPQQLVSFDDINFAYAIGDFDIRQSQPQPPGYPLFVLETRVMRHVFQVKRAESNFLLLTLLGSLAAVWLTWRAGVRMFGSGAGVAGAVLLVLHPTFWYTSLTSPLRVQLAVVSLSVGVLCFRVWQGERRMLLWSALAVGLGSGIRPELGPLLVPLWLAAALRCESSWRERAWAAAALCAGMLAWLVPVSISMGGVAAYGRQCWLYLSAQSQAVGAGALGGAAPKWLQSIVWLAVWAFQGVAWWPLWIPLAWRRGLGVSGSTGVFFAWWAIPMLLFAAVVHVADPGHVMHILPLVCLASGHLVVRAAGRLSEDRRATNVVILAAVAALAMMPLTRVEDWALFMRDGDWLLWLGWFGVFAGLILRLLVVDAWESGWARGLLASLLTPVLIAPVLIVNGWLFYRSDFTYKTRSSEGFAGMAEMFRFYVHDAFHMSRAQGIWNTANTDDHSIRATLELRAERPGQVWLVWRDGESPWRKAAYYLPDLPVLVMTERLPDRAPVLQWIRGPKLEKQVLGEREVEARVPAGTRLIFWSDARTPAYRELSQAVALTRRGSVYFVDLPQAPGELKIGKYRIVW